MLKSFILVVMDHDNKTFSVEGPMLDDRPWNTAVCAAQDAGRRITCFSASDDLNVDSVSDQIARQFPEYLPIPRGSIVLPTA
jgi:hypothetical protein